MPSASNHGAATRRPVVHGGSRISGLYERDLQDGSTVYEYRVRIGGKLTRGTIKDAATRTDAVREFRRLLSDRDYGIERENRLMNPTLDELLDEWLADLRARVGLRDPTRRVAEGTVTTHECRARLYVRPVLGRARVADLDVTDARKLVRKAQAKGLAPATVNGVLAVLVVALEFALENGYVQRNVARDLPRSAKTGRKRITEPRYLTYDEVETLLDAAASAPILPLRAILACCFYGALRIGETLGLQWECVDFKGGVIAVRQQAAHDARRILPYTKSAASNATIPLAPALARELLEHRSRAASVNLQRVRPEALVFVGRDGQMISATSTLEALKRVATDAGLNPPGLPQIGHHDLRHSAAALALQHGAGPEQAAEFLRHSSPMVTMQHYGGLNADSRGAALRTLLDAGIGV